MTQITGYVPGVRPALPRPAPPVTRVDRSVDPRPQVYRHVEKEVQQEQTESPARTNGALAPRGVEPVSTQAVLNLRRTAAPPAPVARIAEAYGLAPAAVRRMLRAAAGEGVTAPGGGGDGAVERTAPGRD